MTPTLSEIKMLTLKLCAQRTLKRSLFSLLFSMLSLHQQEILRKLLRSSHLFNFILDPCLKTQKSSQAVYSTIRN